MLVRILKDETAPPARGGGGRAGAASGPVPAATRGEGQLGRSRAAAETKFDGIIPKFDLIFPFPAMGRRRMGKNG
jgi:hypothetical protein